MKRKFKTPEENNCSNIHSEISELSESLQCSFWEATLLYCEKNLIDPEDLLQYLDKQTVERIRQSAIDLYLVQRKFVPKNKELNLVDK